MTMLEKAARALALNHCNMNGEFAESFKDVYASDAWRMFVPQARVVLAAIRKPDEAMIAAAQRAWLKYPERKSSTIYTAMLDAILAEPPVS